MPLYGIPKSGIARLLADVPKRVGTQASLLFGVVMKLAMTIKEEFFNILIELLAMTLCKGSKNK